MIYLRFSFFLLTIALLFEPLFAQGGFNVQHVGQVRTRGTSGYSQIWGYNGPGGKEYAIMGCNGGTQIVDITSDTLKEVAFIPGPSSGWREMKVYQKYLYVVTEGNGAGLQIIDLDSLKLVKTITTLVNPSGHTVSIEGKYLYINGARYGNGGIVVMDLTDPVNPVKVGEYQTQYVHDCVIKDDTIYAAAIYGQGIDIIDATNKANMKRVSITNYPYSGTHNTDVSPDKKYVYSTDEINSSPDQNGNILRVWDRTDITNLKLVGSYVARPKTIAHNIHLKGNYGYLAHYSEGLRILDLKYPEIPVEVAHYDTYIGSVNSYVGAWGTFPYFNSNKVVISDMSGGMHVIKFPGQDGSVKAARAILTVKDEISNLPIADVKVYIPGRFDTLITDNEGKIKFGLVTDTVTVTLIKSTYSSGYITKYAKLVMEFDSLKSLTVNLTPSQSGSLVVNVTNKVSSQPIKNLGLKVLGTPVSGKTDSLGKFTVPALLGGTSFSVVASQWGFLTETLSVNIIGGTQNNLSFQLTPNGLDNFEVDKGWTVGSPQDSGKTGIWERAKPNAATVGTDTLQPNKNHTQNGTLCFVTGASSSVTDYVEYRTTLTSPTFYPAGMSNPTILYWIFFNSRSTVKDDTLFIQVSNDNGATWKTANSISGKQPFWKQYRIELNSFVATTSDMRIRFVAFDGGNSSVFDAAIDDVEYGDNLQLSVDKQDNVYPTDYVLSQNYPNPFNPLTVIGYQLPVNSFVTLKVYDLLGKEVTTLVNEQQSFGHYTVTFNGAGLSSGVYFYKLQAGNFIETKKLMLAK